MTFVVRLSWIAALAVLSAPQIGPSNAVPPGARTGLIAGQVVDSSGAAVADAIVRLTLRGFSPDLPTTPGGRVMADREGRFFFAELTPGEYFLQASKDGHAGGTYAQQRPDGPSLPFSLVEGERRTDVTLKLWKYGVIAGTVVDEAGEPVVGVGVRALPRDIVGGRERFGREFAEFSPVAITDDRGMFRLSRLTPGTYIVVVPSTQTTLPVGLLGAAAQDQALRSDLFFSGITEVAPLGQPRVQQSGDFAMLTLGHVLIPPPPRPDGRIAVYRTTYYPAAATAAEAGRIAVDSGEERADISIALAPVPAVSVSGRLAAPDGSAPPPMSICLAGDSAAGVIDSGMLDSSVPATGRFENATGMSAADGRFTLLGVPAGAYLLKSCNRALGLAASQGRRTYWLSHPLTVGARDVTDLSVEVRPGLRVEGRVVFRASSRQPTTPPLPFSGLAFETPSGEPGRFAIEGKQDGTFATVAAGGRFIVEPYDRGGWFAESVVAGDKDLTDRAFDLQSDLTSLVVTYTDRPSKVTGVVKSTRGEIVTTAMVLAFPVDSDRWTGYGPNPRLLKSAATSRTGTYTFAHLPAGDYYVVAIDAAESSGWNDPKTLEALAGQARKITIEGNAESPKTLDLTLKAIR